MEWLFSNIEALLTQFGYLALFAIVFAESGLFFGFFLPGDSLLFAAGLLASQGVFDVWITFLVVFVAAVLGDQAGYWMGNKWGRSFFVRPNSWLFKPKRLLQAENFYKKHGKKTIVLARFVPAVRTFTPIFAGIVKMDYQTFIKYNVLGGFLWSAIFVGAGFYLGSVFPQIENYFFLIIAAIIVFSVIPLALEYMKNRKN